MSIDPFLPFHLYICVCNTCICGIYMSVIPIFKSLRFLVWFSWYKFRANKEATEPRVLLSQSCFVNIMGNLSHKWQRLCSVCRNHNLTLSLLLIYHWVCNKSNTRGTTGGTETAYPPGAHEFIPGFCSICRFLHNAYTSWCIRLSFSFWPLFC